MHRFYVPGAPAVGDTVLLSADEIRHAQVLRLAPSAKIELICESGGRFFAEFQEGAKAYLLEALESNEPPIRITLFMGMPKADKLEFVVQKAAELGAFCVVPVQMTRSVAIWDKRDYDRKTERLVRIAREAAKQCGRASPPEILTPRPLAAALSGFSGELIIMPHPKEAKASLMDARRERPDAREIGLIIGPEGGIADEEAGEAVSRGALPVTLGPRILRTETAAVAALALIMGLWGDLA